MSLFYLDKSQVQNAYRGLALAITLFFSAAAGAASAPDPYTPVPGQKGKDVVWIPSPTDMVEKMLDMAKVAPEDFVIDLGSGDGRNVIAAAKRGARALGVEYNADLVELSKRNAQQAGVADKASFVQGDMYAADISKASVMILFLIPQNLWKLLPNFLAQLKPGTRIVSNTYEIGMGWDPDDTDRLKGCLTWCVAYLYIVPAKVEGRWRLGDGELAIEQSYQQFSGTYTTSGLSVPVTGVLRGTNVRFGINNVEYNGSVTGDTMQGFSSGRTERNFTATRVR